jgi:hypothetical protein
LLFWYFNFMWVVASFLLSLSNASPQCCHIILLSPTWLLPLNFHDQNFVCTCHLLHACYTYHHHRDSHFTYHNIVTVSQEYELGLSLLHSFSHLPCCIETCILCLWRDHLQWI